MDTGRRNKSKLLLENEKKSRREKRHKQLPNNNRGRTSAQRPWRGYKIHSWLLRKPLPSQKRQAWICKMDKGNNRHGGKNQELWRHAQNCHTHIDKRNKASGQDIEARKSLWTWWNAQRNLHRSPASNTEKISDYTQQNSHEQEHTQTMQTRPNIQAIQGQRKKR